MIKIDKSYIPKIKPEKEWKGYPKDSMSYFIITELQGVNFGTLLGVLGITEQELTKKILELSDLGVIEPPQGYTPKDFLIPETLLPSLDTIDTAPLNEKVELSEELKEEILRVYHALPQLTQLQLFSLKPGYTAAEVTKSYKKLTKRFHPDKYFGKELGSFKGMLEQIFDSINKSYSELLQNASAKSTPEEIAYQPTIAATPERILTPPGKVRSSEQKIDTSSKTMAVSTVNEVGKVVQDDSKFETIGSQKKKDYPKHNRGISLKDLLSKAVSKNKEKAKIHFEEGKKSLSQGNFASAASHLKVAMTFDPSNKEIRDAYEVAATKAGEISSKYYVQKAEMEWDLGHRGEAINFQMMAVELSRKEEHLISAAEMLMSVGKYTQAKDLSKEAITLNPEGKGRLMLAKVYIAAEKYRRALSTLEEYLKLHPGDSEANLLISMVKGKIK